MKKLVALFVLLMCLVFTATTSADVARCHDVTVHLIIVDYDGTIIFVDYQDFRCDSSNSFEVTEWMFL